MKYLITLFAVLFLNSVCSKVTEQAKRDSVQGQITKLDKKINVIEKDLSQSLIQEYKDLNNLYSVGFTILIGLFGIIFPAVLYFVQFKPSQDALKEAKLLLTKLEEKFEESFDEHLRKNKSRLIDQAIESYEKLDEQLMPVAYINLDLYKSEIFNRTQILRLLFLLKRTDIDDDKKEFFARLITFQNQKEIENYFVDIISNNPKDKKCIWGAIYFAKIGSIQYYDLIAEVVLNDYSLGGMLLSLNTQSKNFAFGLLENEKLSTNLKQYELKSFGDNWERTWSKKLNFNKIEETLLWKKYILERDRSL